MGTSLWTVFCGNRAGFGIAETHLTGFWVIFNPFSCTNHGVIIGADILFTCFSLYLLLRKQTSSSDTTTSGQFRKILSVSSAVFNGCLSISYMAFGVWFLVDKLTEGESLSPLHEWLVILFQGLSWLLLTLTLCLKKNPFTSPFTMKIWSILALVYACFLCIPSLWFSVAFKEVSVKLVADVLSLPGSVLLLLLAFFKSRPEYDGSDGLHEPLLDGTEEETEENVSPFAKAGVLSRLTFWWLNPLMKKGKEKTIEDDDIPQLRSEDRARTCYSVFTQMLNRKRKASEAVANSLPILSTIFSWQSKPILTTAFFALIKVLATSASPLLLKEFIEVAEGNKTFANEGYLLTATLFLVKCIESLSERQWLFRTRIIGIQIRSALSAAIYQKQLRLSSSSNITSSEIVSLVTIDAYRIGEFPASFHQMWTTSLQLCLALLILYYCIGLGAVAAIIVVLLTLVGNSPLAKLQTKYRRNFMEKQDRMVQYIAESLSTMKVLKLYAWEMHFKRVIEGLRQDEYEWIKAVSLQRGYNLILFWAAPVLVPIAAFGACYFLGIELTNAKVFTFLASLRLVQEPVRQLPDVVGAFIDAKVALSRIVGFLEAPEIQRSSKVRNSGEDVAICINAKGISWEDERGSVRPNLRDIKLIVRRGEKVAVCGEVGAGKSTLLASILGEVPYVDGSVQANGSLAYVSQNAWIQTGTIQDNILFGSPMDATRYQEALSKCSLTKDLEMLPYGDLTVIGERGVNLSGGQKQRIQLARALYQNADIYLLDDPFSAVDAHTATSLFTEYVMEALAEKTLLLVTHQVDFLPAFNSILLMSDGKIQATSTYHQLLATSDAFNSFVHAHHDSNSVGGLEIEISKISAEPEIQTTTAAAQQLILGDQLIQKEAKDTGDTGYKPYLDYLRHGKGFLYFALASCIHAFFILGQFAQNVWLAVNLQSSSTSQLVVVEVYALIGCGLIVFLVGRSIFIVLLGLSASKSIFSVLINSLFKAPMFFYDSTPLGRILSRVSSDLSTVDIDIPMRMTIALGTTMNSYLCLCILAVLSWEVVFLIIPLVYLAILLQRYYFSAAKELMRINGTTKSTLSSHAAETAAGNITIRAFGKEDKFFAQNLDLIDKNASPYLHSFAANEWLIQRLDLICTIVLSATALFMTVIQDNTSSGFVGMALSYGLSLNMFLTTSVQSQCTLANMMVSVERLEQYMHIPSEAPEIIATNRPSPLWPNAGRVEILNLKVRYRPNSPLVLKGISCVIEGGHKVGIVGRTGSGKTTLISTLFRLVEPTEGHIIIDGLDISTIGLHDLRSCFGVIPQDPTLFGGSVRYNLDPLHEHTDHEIWQVLEKCQLREAVKEKSEGLSSFVVQDGSNWSMGQRQLFCLGRALLKKRKILVLDEATASIDNATDAIIQRAIRTEFDSSTVITVAHRIPTVLDSTMVLAMSDGRLVEYDEPSKLMNEETSMFGQLVREYWAQTGNAATG